jgi:hypothetical protein
MPPRKAKVTSIKNEEIKPKSVRKPREKKVKETNTLEKTQISTNLLINDDSDNNLQSNNLQNSLQSNLQNNNLQSNTLQSNNLQSNLQSNINTETFQQVNMLNQKKVDDHDPQKINNMYYEQMKQIYAELATIKEKQMYYAEQETKLNEKLKNIYTILKSKYNETDTSKSNIIEMKIPKPAILLKDNNNNVTIQKNNKKTLDITPNNTSDESSDDNVKSIRRKYDSESDSDSE